MHACVLGVVVSVGMVIYFLWKLFIGDFDRSQRGPAFTRELLSVIPDARKKCLGPFLLARESRSILRNPFRRENSGSALSFIGAKPSRSREMPAMKSCMEDTGEQPLK